MSEAWKRNLAVPFFTQRDNTYIWQQVDPKTNLHIGSKYPMAWQTCNITSLCMILHCWGLTEDTPNQMMEKAFEHFGWNHEAYVIIKGGLTSISEQEIIHIVKYFKYKGEQNAKS